MKKRIALSQTIRLFAACALVLAMTAGCTTYIESDDEEYYEPAQPEPPEYYSSGEFGELTEYGTWIHTAPFGWVWQPDVYERWQPFYDGHWVWSQWGWTWVSYEPYGWAVYHYGNWVFDPIFAWIWIPAYDWYPSRVQWIVYDDYICWAPLGPPGYLIGDPWASPIDDLWIIVEPGYFTHTHVGRYTKRRYRWKTTSSTITQVFRNAPDVRYIGRHTRRPIPKVDIELKKFKAGSKELKKMKLPSEHRKTVDRYKAKTRKRIEQRDDRRKPSKKEKIKKPKRREPTKTKVKKKSKSPGEEKPAGTSKMAPPKSDKKKKKRP
ncbi:MAG: DUF6600 domain-containing protein [Candidatus Krumholzibacteria bacterium]